MLGTSDRQINRVFLRFIRKDVDPLSGVEKGIFKIAYQLRDEALLHQIEVDYLLDLLAWFKEHLPIPTEFGSIINGDPDTNRGICWFRASSNEVVTKVWELKTFMESQGILIDVLKADSVGYWLYEDEHQVVAEPRRTAYKKLKRHS